MAKSYFGEKKHQKINESMILVTGGTGLVGSHLLYELVQKEKNIKAIIRDTNKIQGVEKVFSYYSDKPKRLIEKIDWIEADLFDSVKLEDAFQAVKYVYHCAAIVEIGGKKKQELIDINTELTENIVNLCLQNNIEKLCHVSSIASLGGALNGELITEESKWIASKNHSAYSVSKFKSEMEVWRGIQEGLNAVIVNPSVILGPGFWKSSSGALFTKAAKGMRFFTAGATGFVDVRDVAKAMVLLMESEIINERFILNSENISYKQLFDLVADEMKIKKPKTEATKSMLRLAYILDYLASKLGIKKQEITKDIVRAGNSKSMYSNKKIADTLNYGFISIRKSIEDIANKFKQEVKIN